MPGTKFTLACVVAHLGVMASVVAIGCGRGFDAELDRSADQFVVQRESPVQENGRSEPKSENTPPATAVPSPVDSAAAANKGGGTTSPSGSMVASSPAPIVQSADGQAVGGVTAPSSSPANPATTPPEPSATQAVTVPVSASTSAATSHVTDLLAMVVPERDSRDGVWQREGDALVSPPQALTVLTFPYRVEGNFKLTIVAERIQGQEALNLVVPFGGRPAMFVLEGFGKKVTGLNLVRGMTADQSPGSLRGTVFLPGKPTEITCLVSMAKLSLRCDGNRLTYTWSGSPDSVQLDSRFWTGIPGDRISLTVYSANTRFRISRAVLEPLTADEIAAATAPPSRPSRPPVFFDERNLGSGMDHPPGSPPPRATAGVPVGQGGEAMAPASEEVASSPRDYAPPRLAPAEPAPEESQRRKESVCLIETPLGSGSGFVLADNIIATNAHVTADAFADEIKLSFGSQRSQSFRASRILYEDGLRDICLLEAQVSAPPIPFRSDYEMKRGDQVVVIGNPSLGETGILLRDAVTTGRISALVHTGGCDFYQIHAEISPGSSGGPVLSWSGEVVGIIAMKATDKGEDEIRKAMTRLDRSVVSQAGFASGRGIAFAVPAPVVAEALAHAQSAASAEVGKVEVWHNARVILRRSAMLWALHFIKFCANVPPAVREQEINIRFRRIPASALRQIKQVDLIPPEEASALLSLLEGPEVSRIVRACSNQLDERFEALRSGGRLPEDALKSLDDLRRAVSRAKGLAENPPTNYQYYSKAFYDQKDSVKALVERLVDQLHVEEAGYE
ncbi:S1C family serine protease [Thermopirellula anaerolimosa]